MVEPPTCLYGRETHGCDPILWLGVQPQRKICVGCAGDYLEEHVQEAGAGADRPQLKDFLQQYNLKLLHFVSSLD